jgi:hypothetical protein
MSTTDAEGVELTHRMRQVGSGGEQGVPNYLLVLALAKLMFDAAGAAVRPLLFDEAFYGIDAGRRDQLLRLATDLGLQLCVASPDQDGTTAAVRAATTLFVIKDPNHDVHLAPYHFWNRARADQAELFAGPAEPAVAESGRRDRCAPPAKPSSNCGGLHVVQSASGRRVVVPDRRPRQALRRHRTLRPRALLGRGS